LRRNVRGPTCGAGETLSPVPSPRGDSHHGPVYRDKPGKSDSGSLLPRETAASTILAEGAGEERAARAGWGGEGERSVWDGTKAR
jgi:hypothetical protein